MVSFPEINESFHMGDLMEGTYCSRIFSDCDKKRCVLQSPNYPGLYPRNLTCYYAIRQHSIPYGHQALISITQPYSRLVSIKTDRTNPEGADPKPVERKVYLHDIMSFYTKHSTRTFIFMQNKIILHYRYHVNVNVRKSIYRIHVKASILYWRVLGPSFGKLNTLRMW